MRLLENQGKDGRPLCLVGYVDEKPIGVICLSPKKDQGRLFGDPDVCDYLDVATVGGWTGHFFEGLVRYLKKAGIRSLDLAPLLPDSVAMTELLPLARKLNMRVAVEEIDASYAFPLPETWEGYLLGLTGHQRHEIRRKLKKLAKAGPYRFYEVKEPFDLEKNMDRFIDWFRRYHPGKKSFMDAQREAFFKGLTEGLFQKDLLRLFVLEIGPAPAAVTLCIEYQETLYLYNNAYDPKFGKLSVGTLSKVLSIREGIHRRHRFFDFLKGRERYKKHLGGKRVPLFRCRITLSP